MNRIQELRKEAGLKQSDLADLLSLTRQTVSNYELGLRDMDPDTILRLCEIFHVTADYLLGFSDVRTFKLTGEEYRLLEAYRAADDRARNMVDLALEPWLGGARQAADAG